MPGCGSSDVTADQVAYAMLRFVLTTTILAPTA
jgi:hypothetical protein